jgi:hypothetical protein
MRSPRAARAFLGVICAYAALIGAVAAFAPHVFYADFPFVAHWVELLLPYNQHLVTDVGGLYLGFAVLFGWAVWAPERRLALAACSAFVVVAFLHLVYHVAHLDNFGTADAIAEVAGLALLLVPPAVVIWGVGEPPA